MNFWVTVSTCNWVSISNRFFTCIAAWGKGNVYSDKEPKNMLLLIFGVLSLNIQRVLPVSK